MSLELVTAHTGTAHITAEQVASLIKGAISDDTDNLYRFQTGNQCAYSITDALQVQINTGDAVLSGRHFQITEAETFDIDPSTLNYSRIDGIFFEIYSDNDTSEELCRFVTVQGSEYLTSGGTASLPATPDSVDDTHTLMYVFPWLYVYVSYETITEVEDGTTLFPSMLDFESRITTEEAATETINETIETMQETFQAGVDSIYNAIVAEGVTPSSSTPTDCATGIATVADNQYTSGYDTGTAAGYITGYDEGYAAGYSDGSSTEVGSLSFIESYSTMPNGIYLYTALSSFSSIAITTNAGVIGGSTMCTVRFLRASGASISSYTITDSGQTISFPANTGRVAVIPNSGYSSSFTVKLS